MGESAMFGFQVIPANQKALVTYLSGRVEDVEGPARISPFAQVDFFQRIVVEEDRQGYLVGEDGAYERIEEPGPVFVHPNGGRWIPDQRIDLASHEAVVVIDEKGVPNLKKGDEHPQVSVTAKERLHNFLWTGSGDESEEKIPGALKITVLRLQPTQTYLSFMVRTKDNVFMTLYLMIYYEYDAPEKLIKADDPMGAMYNKIMSEIVEHIAGMSFDDFKEETNRKIGDFSLSEEVGLSRYLEEFGIKATKVVVRKWTPNDRSITQVLSQAATIQTQKTLDEAEHERRMLQIQNEQVELQKRAELDEDKKKAAEAEGERRALEHKKYFEALSASVGEDTAKRLLPLVVAGQARGGLVLSPSMLGVENR